MGFLGIAMESIGVSVSLALSRSGENGCANDTSGLRPRKFEQNSYTCKDTLYNPRMKVNFSYNTTYYLIMCMGIL